MNLLLYLASGDLHPRGAIGSLSASWGAPESREVVCVHPQANARQVQLITLLRARPRLRRVVTARAIWIYTIQPLEIGLVRRALGRHDGVHIIRVMDMDAVLGIRVAWEHIQQWLDRRQPDEQ